MFAMIFVIAALAQDASALPEAPVGAPQVCQTVEKDVAVATEDSRISLVTQSTGTFLFRGDHVFHR